MFNWTLIWESKMTLFEEFQQIFDRIKWSTCRPVYHTTIGPPHLPPLVTDWPYWKSISKNCI